LPRLKQHGLRVKRRLWSSGAAERLWGTAASAFGCVHSEKQGPERTLIHVSWVLRH
jgi:hypothetical protein